MFDRTYFVLAPSFHGATILSKLLNAHPDVSALGDTYPANNFDQVCGCGNRVSQCKFWQVVKREISARRYPGTRLMLPSYPGDTGSLSGRLLYSDFTSFWASPENLNRVLSKQNLQKFHSDYVSFLSSVYEHTVKPGQVFIDGVKYISRVSALHAAEFPVSGIIHLHRDAGDFVMSSMKNVGTVNRAAMVKYALRYRLFHARVKQLYPHIPYVNISYEIMADDIDTQLGRLFRFIGVKTIGVEQLRNNFNQEWHFMGNSSLFKFDGVFRRSHHEMPDNYKLFLRVITGSK